MNDKIRVLIVDDSAVIRSLVTRMLGKCDKLEVCGTALNGRYALNKLESVRPDVIVLDIEMPEMNGIEFLQECNKLNIKVPTIILSAVARKGAKLTMEAMAQGASAFLLKPNQDGTDLETLESSLIETILALGTPNSYRSNNPEERHILYDLANSSSESNVERPTFDADKYLPKIANRGSLPNAEIVVIGISTGGPMALRDILPMFPADFPIPIVIVQHMPAGFTQEFALSLDKICPLEVKEANDGDYVQPGRILIAPGHAHVIFAKRPGGTVIQILDTDLVNGHKPSASVLFKSAAASYGSTAIACIMTGMGKDGADTIGDVLKCGGVTIAQDQSTSVVFGMPRVAIENGNIQLVRPLKEIVPTIIDVVTNHRLPV